MKFGGFPRKRSTWLWRSSIGHQLASVMLSTVESPTGDEFDYSKLISDTALDAERGTESDNEKERGTGSPELG